MKRLLDKASERVRMPRKSVAFDRMRKALFEAMRDIPSGRVTEYSTMGFALNIPARHVAFILSGMTIDERDLLPWHRLVPKNGRFGSPRNWSDDRCRQVESLRKEGVTIDDSGTIVRLHETLHEPDNQHANTFWADMDGV